MTVICFKAFVSKIISLIWPLLLKAFEGQCSCATHCPVTYHLISLLSFTKYRTLLCLSGFLFKEYSDIQRGQWIVVNRCHRIDISLNFIIHFSNLSTNLSVTFIVQFSVQIRSMSMSRLSQQIEPQEGSVLAQSVTCTCRFIPKMLYDD